MHHNKIPDPLAYTLQRPTPSGSQTYWLVENRLPTMDDPCPYHHETPIRLQILSPTINQHFWFVSSGKLR